MNFEEFFAQLDRSMYAGIDPALGRAFRALTEHEQSIHLTLHAGLYGPDRAIVELITSGIPASTALEKIQQICRLPVIRRQDPALAKDVRPIVATARAIARRRNDLAHQIIEVADDSGENFSLVTATKRASGDVSVESLDALRADARESTLAMSSVARRLLKVLQHLPEPELELDEHITSFYARATASA